MWHAMSRRPMCHSPSLASHVTGLGWCAPRTHASPKPPSEADETNTTSERRGRTTASSRRGATCSGGTRHTRRRAEPAEDEPPAPAAAAPSTVRARRRRRSAPGRTTTSASRCASPRNGQGDACHVAPARRLLRAPRRQLLFSWPIAGAAPLAMQEALRFDSSVGLPSGTTSTGPEGAAASAGRVACVWSVVCTMHVFARQRSSRACCVRCARSSASFPGARDACARRRVRWCALHARNVRVGERGRATCDRS